MDNALFEKFGKLVVEKVRDNRITFWDLLLDEKRLSSQHKHYEQTLKTLDADQLEMLRDLGILFIDATIHDFLFLLESEEWINVSLKSDDKGIDDIREVALGALQGYIYLWAERYSKKPLSDE